MNNTNVAYINNSTFLYFDGKDLSRFLLFEDYSQASWDLHYSLLRSGYTKYPVIVLNDDGFLPNDVISPVQLLTGYDLVADSPTGGLHQSHLPTLEGADFIYLGGTKGEYRDLSSRVVARVEFKSSVTRIVKSISYLDAYSGKVTLVENYCDKGYVFRRDIYSSATTGSTYTGESSENSLLAYHYFKPFTNSPYLVHTVATGSYAITSDNVFESRYFTDYTSFLLFFFEYVGLGNSGIIFNSLNMPFKVLVSSLEDNSNRGTSYLFWSERLRQYDKEDGSLALPSNMNYLLDNYYDSGQVRVLFQVREDFARLSSNNGGGVASPYASKIGFSGFSIPVADTGIDEIEDKHSNILITTNTDDVRGLEYIISRRYSSKKVFHLVAPTNMSDKLLSLSKKYEGILKLYPASNKAKVESLFKSCGVFLDIANSNTVFDANRLALLYGCVRLGLWGISSSQYIPDMSMFNYYGEGVEEDRGGLDSICNVIEYIKNNNILKTLYDSQNVLCGMYPHFDYTEVLK